MAAVNYTSDGVECLMSTKFDLHIRAPQENGYRDTL